MAPRTVPKVPATRHRCRLQASVVSCTKTTAGRPTRKKCPGCGAQFDVEVGYYGTFDWDPKGRAYRPEDAHSLHRTEVAAEAANEGTERVVRWVPMDAVSAARWE